MTFLTLIAKFTVTSSIRVSFLLRGLTVYKVVAKLLANGLVKISPKLISLNQPAITKGRFISDNILLAEEHLRGFQQKNTSKRVCINLDLDKAFDSASWVVIKQTMKSMNFLEP